MTYLLVSFITGVAQAASDTVQSGEIVLKLPDSITASGENGFLLLWTTITDFLFGFLAVMAFVGIVYSGIMMITSAGDATKLAAGRKNLLWSIIGIIVISLSFIIIRFVYGFVTGGIATEP